MHGLRTAAARGLQDRVGTQVTVRGRQSADAESFIAGGDMPRLRVGV